MSAARITVRAAGRINLIGEHTDYTGGWALPMTIDRFTTVDVERRGDVVHLVSDHDPRPAVVPIDIADPAALEPSWARYVAGVVAELRPDIGAVGTVSSTLPIGAGVSSSASLELAVATALGFSGTPLELALACQRAEQRASGVPCGIMDQLAIACGRPGFALLLDCTSLDVQPVPLPDDLQVVGVHSGQSRQLAGSAYAQRRAQCAAAESDIGPLREATLADVRAITDPVIRKRARHVVTENARVLDVVDALGRGDAAAAGMLLDESHESLRRDFEVSTTTLDRLVEHLRGLPGVLGARMTGAGFGGMVVVLMEAGAALPSSVDATRYTASAGVSATFR